MDGISLQRTIATHHRTQETYSPVGRRNLRMYWSGVQSTGAEMRKYFTKGEGQSMPRTGSRRLN